MLANWEWPAMGYEFLVRRQAPEAPDVQAPEAPDVKRRQAIRDAVDLGQNILRNVPEITLSCATLSASDLDDTLFGQYPLKRLIMCFVWNPLNFLILKRKTDCDHRPAFV